MERPEVSIISLAFNQAPYIRECLDGIVSQQAPFTFEVIVNDDASTDGTADIIREYAARYPDIVRPVFHSENQYSRHRDFNRILAPLVGMARGRYIAFCEGDDYWTDPHKLQKQVGFMDARPELSICFTDFSRYFQESGRTEPGILTEKDELTIDDMLDYNQISTPTAMVRAGILRDVMTELCRGRAYAMADYPMWLEVMQHGNAGRINSAMVNYRVLTESASHFTSKKKFFHFLLSGHDVQIFYARKYHRNVFRQRYRKLRRILGYYLYRRWL